MRVLVTGGAGYIGSVATHALVARGHEVVVLDDLSRGHRGAVPSGAQLVIGDHGNSEILGRELPGTDCVMHFSAHSLVGESMIDPGKYFENNVAGGIRLLRAMVEHGVGRFIFSSSAATYGVPDRVPITEDAPTAPTNPYGESKLQLERILEWFHAVHGIRSARLRYFNAAGAIPEAGEHHDPETHLIPLALEVALGRRTHIDVFGDDYPTPDGTCVRDYIHVGDLADAHLRALGALDEIGTDYFNLGNGSGFTVRQVIDAVRRVTGREITARPAPRRPGDPPALVASSVKAAARLGWKPEHPHLDDIIRSAWEWARAHPDGYAE